MYLCLQMSRHERFHADLLENIDKLVTTVEPSYILQQPMQTHIFNKNLAQFLKVTKYNQSYNNLVYGEFSLRVIFPTSIQL